MARSTTSNPPPGRPGGETSGLASAARDLVGAAVRFAWPAAVLGLAVFGALQWSRIRLWWRIAHETRRGTHTMSPDFIVRYGSWFEGVVHAPSGIGDCVYARDYYRAVRIVIAEILGLSLIAGLAWATLLAGVIVVGVARSRAVPYELSLPARMRIAGRALRSASVWSAAAAAASAGAVWHIGFDRSGFSRALLLDGLWPTSTQGLSMLAAWGVLGAAAAIALVRPALRAAGPSEDLLVCARCRYRAQGLRARVCPECNGPIPEHDPGSLPSAWAVHRAVMRLSAAGVVLIAVVLGALMWSSQRVADWALLRPAMILWVNSPACRVAQRPVQLDTIYGPVMLSAERNGPGAAPGDTWLVSWALDPNPNAADMPRSGAFSVAPRPRAAVAPVMHETPFGPLWWWAEENDPHLQFGYPPTIVRSVRP